MNDTQFNLDLARDVLFPDSSFYFAECQELERDR